MKNKSPPTVDNTEAQIDYREICIMQQTIMDCANYSIISTDLTGTISSANKAACDTLGYTADELVGKHTPALFHDSEEIAANAKRLSEELGRPIEPGFEVFVAKANAGINDETQWTHIRKDGSRLPVMLSVTALKDYSGNINGYLGICFDISESVSIKQALQEQRERYQLLFESSSDSIFLMKNDTFIDCNPATLKMFGCDREQIINQTPSYFSPKYQPDGQLSQEKALENINIAMQGETLRFEWLHQRLDGTPFDAEVNLSTIEINESPLIFATVRDISNQKKAERALEFSNKQLEVQNENLWLINHLSNKLRGRHSFEVIVNNTVDSLLELSNITHATVFLIDKKGEYLELAASRGFKASTLAVLKTIQLEGSLSGIAIKQGQTIYSDNLKKDSRIADKVLDALMAEGINSGMLVPLMFEGKVYGSITVVHKASYKFSQVEIETLDVIGNTVSQSLDNAQQIIDLEKMALRDSLTGLSNRLLFHRTFEEKICDPNFSSAALMLLDLNRFKEVNDTLGHHIGDVLLQKIGPRIESLFSKKKFQLCRLGGDEFTVLVDNIDDRVEILKIAQRLSKGLRQPFEIGSMMLEIDASIGIAMYPDDGKDSHALLRSADVAMYEAKNSGGGIQYYDIKQDKHTPERLQLMAELNTAIREGQLELHYQPKISLLDGKISGFEALVRWNHPTLGLLYPEKFVPLAEMSDSIHYLTQEVIQQVLIQQQHWILAGYDLPVAVNLSARNLIDDRCVDFLAEMVSKFKLKPGMLELEVTETALMQDPEKATERLNRISELKIMLSIDDFGTGYSSLSYLRRMPIDLLKIDREFVKDMLQNDQDSVIVSSTISLAHNLNLLVIAEGVENQKTLDYLTEMNCDLVQGYHICKPKPWAEIEHWLEQRN